MRRDNHAHAWAIAGAALLAAVATGACNSERERTAERAPGQQAERAPTPAPAPTTDVDTVKEHPAWYYDKKVRVTGEVDEVYSDRAFRLEGTGWAFDDDITVLMKKPMDVAAGGALKDDDELIVNGTVRRFVVADVERDIGWDLSPEIEVKLKERPVLVADSVRKVGPPEKTAAAEPEGEVDTVSEIVATADQKSLAGKKVELGREKVQAIAGKGLWIGPTFTEKVFVIPVMLPKDVVVGDIVAASGTLREVPANALESWDLPKEMADDLGKVVYVEAASLREVPTDDERRN
ncbi:hypothetical protein [Nannocystis punicea]|uniref:Lipoprotein n=1 Tax=Nannocystis punicea TaxID=2995304 RepID=A0ABY7GUG1_9BACT|nr:hypothetical protein [Nannocystis poenicansa]WAS90600.1 hypothetical protein O0S08_30810 [Nannocystis poenicansa]